MRKLFLSIAVCIAFGVSAQEDRLTADQAGKLEWLIGAWEGKQVSNGRTVAETWERDSSGILKGQGFVMKGKDTLLTENVKIINKNGQLNYVADVRENKAPVYFLFTGQSDSSFVCENPQHDFPKKISYTLSANVLKGVVSGNGKQIEYVFERSNDE